MEDFGLCFFFVVLGIVLAWSFYKMTKSQLEKDRAVKDFLECGSLYYRSQILNGLTESNDCWGCCDE